MKRAKRLRLTDMAIPRAVHNPRKSLEVPGQRKADWPQRKASPAMIKPQVDSKQFYSRHPQRVESVLSSRESEQGREGSERALESFQEMMLQFYA